MSSHNKSDLKIDSLGNLFKDAPFRTNETLQEIFDKRINDLDISRTTALEIMQIERLSLNGILTGSQKRADFSNLIKLSQFLKISREEVVRLYLEALEKTFPELVLTTSNKAEFIKNNFDLASLKSSKFIDSITDFDKIEAKIVSHFGLKSIFDYKKPNIKPAFSEDIIKPKNQETRDFWLLNAIDKVQLLNNPYEYNRTALIEYFPQIRWHTINVELGLINVVKDLYKLGITVIYQPSMADLKLRGATFSINEKPVIVLSNYRGFYATLWWAFVHELFHVIFDWDEIKNGKYHISEEKSERLTVIEKETEADSFAREYLLPAEKLNAIKPHLIDTDFVYQFAADNHLHANLIYVFYAYDYEKTNRMAWARANRHNPNMDNLLSILGDSWDKSVPITEFVKEKRSKIYK